MICECIKKLAEYGYVQANILKPGQYFIYLIDNKGKVGKSPVQVVYCPVCGTKLIVE
jgi:hypothetical protein